MVPEEHLKQCGFAPVVGVLISGKVEMKEKVWGRNIVAVR